MIQNKPEQKSIKDRIINPPEHVGDPECKLCYGKGYSSELSGISWGSDLGVGNPGREDILNMKPCKCTKPKPDTSKCKPLWGDCECRHQKPEPTESWEELFDEWNEETGAFVKRTSLYFEVKAFIKAQRQSEYERGKREEAERILNNLIDLGIEKNLAKKSVTTVQ